MPGLLEVTHIPARIKQQIFYFIQETGAAETDVGVESVWEQVSRGRCSTGRV